MTNVEIHIDTVQAILPANKYTASCIPGMIAVKLDISKPVISSPRAAC